MSCGVYDIIRVLVHNAKCCSSTRCPRRNQEEGGTSKGQTGSRGGDAQGYRRKTRAVPTRGDSRGCDVLHGSGPEPRERHVSDKLRPVPEVVRQRYGRRGQGRARFQAGFQYHRDHDVQRVPIYFKVLLTVHEN